MTDKDEVQKIVNDYASAVLRTIKLFNMKGQLPNKDQVFSLIDDQVGFVKDLVADQLVDAVYNNDTNKPGYFVTREGYVFIEDEEMSEK